MERLIIIVTLYLLIFSRTTAQNHKQCQIIDRKVYAGYGNVQLGNAALGIKPINLPDSEIIIPINSNSSFGNFETSCFDSIYKSYVSFQKLSGNGTQVIWQRCFSTVYNAQRAVAIPKSNKRALSIICDAVTWGGLGTGPGIELTDSIGNQIWIKSYGGIGSTKLKSILPMSDGGFVLGCENHAFGGDVGPPIGSTGHTDIWILRVDSIGNKIWAHTFGGTNDERPLDLALAPNGGIYVLGQTLSTDSDFVGNAHPGDEEGFVVRLDSLGNKLWAHCFGGSNAESFFGGSSDGRGGVMAVGYASSIDGDVTGFKGAHDDLWVVSIDSTGNLNWDKCFGSTKPDAWQEGYHICQAADSTFWIEGQCFDSGDDIDSVFGGNDIWVLHISGIDGSLINSRVIGSSDFDEPVFIFPTSNGVVIGANYYQPNGTMIGLPIPQGPGGSNGVLVFLGPGSVDVKPVDVVSQCVLTPNPAHNEVKLTYILSTAAEVHVRMINTVGDVVLDIPGQFYGAGGQQKVLSIKNYQVGTYFLQLTVNGYSTFQSLQIIH